jgi:hypothetical protein
MGYMNLMEIIRIWRKRWLLTGFVLLLAVAASGVAAMHLPRTYRAESTVLLLPSRKAASVLGDGNPYLSFSGSLNTAAEVLATELTAPPTTQALAARGFSEPYTAVSESTTSQTAASGVVLPGPFVLITVTGGNQRLVEQTLYGVQGAVRSTVTAMQAGISREKKVTISTLSTSPQATLNVSTTARSLVLIIGLLVVMALGTPLLVDAQATRRRIRRDAGPARSRARAGEGDTSRDRSPSHAGTLVTSSGRAGPE